MVFFCSNVLSHNIGADSHSRRAISDVIYLECIHAINFNTYLTGGLSISFPGDCIKTAVGGDAPNWTGAFLDVVIKF